MLPAVLSDSYIFINFNTTITPILATDNSIQYNDLIPPQTVTKIQPTLPTLNNTHDNHNYTHIINACYFVKKNYSVFL